MVQKSVRDAFREAFKLPSRGVPSTQTLQATTPTTTQPATPTTGVTEVYL
ncbi:unnamed protein product [Anisakis simplex]|uniref:Uncharacterized protein n=1 Tax=Anisakis simplex TaxID=6269 RepID=A0A0M3JJ28_ANISI|nr:unnamed protein product [Anisakis simplex]